MKSRSTMLVVVGLMLTLALLKMPAAAAEPITSLALPDFGTIQLTAVRVTSFDAVDDWENFTEPNGTQFDVENSVYRASTMEPGYAWGLNAIDHTDIVLEADVTPLTIFTDTGAGVMCRADASANGNGYYFMVNGNGYYSIQIGTDNGIEPLVDWTPSKAVHAGIDRNVIRAVCVQDHLALYVNEVLVDSVVDGTYSEGHAGLAVAAGENGVDMAFDSVALYQPRLVTAAAFSK